MYPADSMYRSSELSSIRSKKTVPAASSDSGHKEVFNLSGINASVGSSDTQLRRTKADYSARVRAAGSRGCTATARCAHRIFERLVRNSSFTLFAQTLDGTMQTDELD